MKFLHTADWQLGMRRHFLPAAAGSRFTDDRIEAITTLCTYAAGEGCDFILVCGDVYEAPTIERSIVTRSLEALAASPVPLYLLPGNHDPLNTGSVYRRPEFVQALPPQVHLLSEPGLVTAQPGVELLVGP